MKNIRKILVGGLGAIVLGTMIGNALPSTGCRHREEEIEMVDPKIAIANYVAEHEGRRTKVYDPNPHDGKAEPTIGVGHYLDRGDSRQVFAEVLPEVDFDRVYNGEDTLTSEQVDRLFASDLEVYIQRARNKVPKFDEYPSYLQSAIVDGFYRGCLSGSPKTLSYINQGQFEDAAREYLNNREYKTAIRAGKPGIRTRMEKNQEMMLKYSQESKNNKGS